MVSDKVKVLFFGSGNFALPILRSLMQNGNVQMLGLVTQPDKPVGRKQQMQGPPVKQILAEYPNLPVFQPAKLRREAENILQQTQPQLIIVADYGQILPKTVIDYPKYKCLNVHGSILPDMRGAVPIPMAILQGYESTGVSIPIMTPGLDDGPVLAEQSLDILPDDTTESLTLRLADLGAAALRKLLPAWITGEVQPIEQNHAMATIVDKTLMEREKAEIKANTRSEVADRMIRAFYPRPGAWCRLQLGQRQLECKLYAAQLQPSSVHHDPADVAPGSVYKQNKELYLALPGASLRLDSLQLAGKNRANGTDCLYLAGSSIA